MSKRPANPSPSTIQNLQLLQKTFWQKRHSIKTRQINGTETAHTVLLTFEMNFAKRIVPICICLIAVWGSSMAGAFSSALKLQRDYDLEILRSSIDRVWSIGGGAPRSISLKGDAGYQSYAYTAYVKYPQLRGMIAPILGNAWLMPAIGTSINFDGLKVVEDVDGELVAVGFKYKVYRSDKDFFIEYAY